eukprot:CAMPEP_0114231536 /NCGR_PEP_ID=MMETSP0058-20121206/4101_1 /TAXON_ID=36894 /ORGANISM="Pyramimonas parkeae, CCMP726" /LENGTH=80 /DNA_ID=CAMNT_0001342901 /DNA_START=374 /DNA_END=616 /DNA_ORIENTATION=+
MPRAVDSCSNTAAACLATKPRNSNTRCAEVRPAHPSLASLVLSMVTESTTGWAPETGSGSLPSLSLAKGSRTTITMQKSS